MPKAIAFWVIWLIVLIIFVVLSWPLAKMSYAFLLVFALIGILGWAQFGPPIKG